MLKAFWKYFHKKKNSEKTIFLFSFRFFESADDGATATKTIGGRELFCFPAKTAKSLVLLPMPKQKNFEEEVLWKKKTQWRNCLESVSKVVITFSCKKYGCKLVWIIRRVVTIFSTIMSKNVSKRIGLPNACQNICEIP